MLNQLQESFHQEQFLSSDPLEFIHRYRDPWDQEAVALLAALLAYGNVKQIRASVQNALTRMEGVASSPAEFVRGLESGTRVHREFNGWVHRFTRGPELLK